MLHHFSDLAVIFLQAIGFLYILWYLWEILKLWLKGYKVIILDIPLLFESKMDKWTKPIIVYGLPIIGRDRNNDEDAGNRINAQMALDLKRTKADIVIDNTGSLEDLEEQFQKVLFPVTKSLTWTEFWLSRQGAFSALVAIIIAVVVCRKSYRPVRKLEHVVLDIFKCILHIKKRFSSVFDDKLFVLQASTCNFCLFLEMDFEN